ncbi:cytochrome P450, partial [Thozetella sp. PMI_491]
IYTIDPANVKTVLSTNFSDYHRPQTMPNALNPVMGPGVFTSNGSSWAHSRGLVKSQFSLKRVRKVSKLEPHVRNAFDALGPPQENGWTKEQDILVIFNRFTLDAATEFMFGTSAGSHEEAMRIRGNVHSRGFWSRYRLIIHDFATAFDAALDYVALRLKLGRLWFLADGIAFRLACYKIKSYVDLYIRQAAAHAEAAATKMANGTAAERPNDDERKYGLISDLVHDYPDKIALRNQVMQLLVAGRDTTAATLTWAMILLEAHPECFNRLRGAIIDTFGTEFDPKKPVTFDNTRSCTYLQWVIFEVVRLYPTGPLNARQATCDTVLPLGGGPEGKDPVAVQAGTTVAFNTYLMHRRTDIWGPEAWAFLPERWADRKVGWEYIPFHGGPQTCLGQQHALTEMGYAIVCLLRRFQSLESSTRATNFENGIRTILVPKHRVMMR